MGRITFILGGSRSGKSEYAIKLAKETAKRVIFVATAEAIDKEMRLRVKQHKKNRPSHWKTIEESKDLMPIVINLSNSIELMVIDCLTLLISNLLYAGFADRDIENKIRQILNGLKKAQFNSIIISNEVGLGIVPDNPLARDFRDLAGRINQMVARQANEVYFMASGIPINLKQT